MAERVLNRGMLVVAAEPRTRTRKNGFGYLQHARIARPYVVRPSQREMHGTAAGCSEGVGR